MAEMTDAELEFELQLARDLRNRRKVLAAAQAGPTVREPEQVAAPPVAAPGVAGAEARQKIEATAFKLTPAQEQEALRKAEAEARRKEGALVSPGGRVDVPRLPEEEPGMFEQVLSAVPEALQTAYKFYKPEAKEDIRTIFQRQEIMTPEAVAAATEQAKAEGKPRVEYLPDALRLSLKGVETPLGATLRAISSPFTSAAEVALREALTYDVDPATGKPVDPADLSYLAEQTLRQRLGDENYPSTLATGGLLSLGPVGRAVKAATGFDIGEAPAAELRKAGAPEWLAGFLSEGLTVPTFGPIDYGEGAAPDVAALDPYALRKADTRLDWSDQIIRGARVDRGVKDLYVDMPEVRKAYKDEYGAESAAFYGGILVDMLVPDATMLVGPGVKAAKRAGKGMDAALTGVAAGRLYGGRIAREALEANALRKGALSGEAMAQDVARIVAREAIAPRAIMDAIELSEDTGRALAGLPNEVLRSHAGKWMIGAISAGADPAQAFAELRVAQNMADVQRVWQAAVSAGKTTEEARQAALATARGVLGRGGGYLPTRIAEALGGATSASDAARRIEAIVPRTAAPLVLGAPGSGAAVRNTLNLADDTLEGVGYADAVAKVEESVRKTLGELVPRDMVAVTSKVMVPSELAPALRRAVDAELRGIMEVTPAGLRVADASRARVVEALQRVYPEALRSTYWDDAIRLIERGEVVPPDMATRLADAVQTDAYLRLAPRSAERLANVGRELERATGTALQRFLAGNLASRVIGAYTGRAGGVPGAYASMGKTIGMETFGIPKRIADDVRRAVREGEADPFRRVGEDLASKADNIGMGDNFVEEAWQATLEPLYGPLSQIVRDSIRAGDPAGLAPLLRNPPTLSALAEVDRAIVGVVGEGAMRGVQDFGSALLSGLVEAEAWVTARRVALEAIQDNPGLAVTLTPGLRGFTANELPGLVSRALSDIMAQGTTRAVDPNWIPTGTREYQSVLDAVGASLRAMGVHYVDGVKAEEVAARIVTGIRPQNYEIPGAVFIRPPDLERMLNPEAQKQLAEGVTVLRRTKEGQALLTQLMDFVGGAEQLGRSAAELAAGSNVVSAAGNVLAMPIAIMAREGIASAIGATGRVLMPRADGLLFSAGGRPWTRAAIDAEAARLGVGASTRLSAQRRGRIAADLMADIERTIGGNPLYRGTDVATQTVESAGRIIPGVVDAAERRFRALAFEEGLRRGMTPEQAALYSRDLLLDYEPVQLHGAARALTPIVTRAVEAPAAIRALIERPQEAVRIMRIARARQDYNERTYGGDQPLLEPVPGARPLGGAALAWLSGVLASAYYGQTDLNLSQAKNPVKALADLVGGVSTYTEGEDVPPDEMLRIMLLASMADHAGGYAGAAAGWEALVDRYGLTPINVTKEGVLPEYQVPAGVPTRMGTPPKGGDAVPMAYKMSPEGRKQFQTDWERLSALSLGTAPIAVQAWLDTGMAPEVRVDQPMTPAATLYGQVRQETGR